MIFIEPIRNELFESVSYRHAIVPAVLRESVTSLGHIVELQLTISDQNTQSQYGNSEV